MIMPNYMEFIKLSNKNKDQKSRRSDDLDWFSHQDQLVMV